MKALRRIALLSALLALAVLVSTGPAWAVTILNNWNVSEFNTSPAAGRDRVEVTEGVAGGFTTLTVQWFAGSSGLTALGIDAFWYNADTTGGVATISSENDPSGVWNTNFDGTTADGFGMFNSNKSDNSGGTGGIGTAIVFTLSGLESFVLNATTAGHPVGSKFAAHVRYGNGCSGFVSDGTTTSITSDSNCAPIPEPGTLALVGSGLVGLGTIVRKRLFNRRDDVA